MIYYKTEMSELPEGWKECKGFRKMCRIEHLCIERMEAGFDRPVVCPLVEMPSIAEADRILYDYHSSEITMQEALYKLGYKEGK